MLRKNFYMALLLLSGLTANLYGQEWTLLEKPTSKTLFKQHFLDNLRGWAAGAEGTIIKTTDGAQSWEAQASNISENIIDIFMLDENHGWAIANVYPAATDSLYGTRILKTGDGGNLWENEFFENDYLYTVHFQDSLTGWLGGEFGKLLGTTNGGNTWAQASIDPGPGAQFPIYNFTFYSRQYGYATGGHFDIAGVVWRTQNGGQRWTPIIVGPEPIYGMHFKDSLNITAVGGDLDFGSGMVQSTDGGLVWEYIYLGIFGQARALSFRTETEAWAPLGFTGTYMYSLDEGKSWTAIYTPDSSAIFDLVFTDSLTGYAVGNSGTVLKYGPIVALEPEAGNMPATVVLHQNYPNPFNPSTAIGYQLSAISNVKLTVYNTLGQQVKTLVSQRQAVGLHEIRWDGRDEAGRDVGSGLYIYRLRVSAPSGKAGAFEKSRKMLLIR